MEVDMESYQAMRKRQRAETDAFPLGAAITQESFDEMMRKWGLDPRNDLDKICRVQNIMFCQKKDLPALKEMLNRHIAEIEEGKKNPQFLYEMFYHELAETEFGYDGVSIRQIAGEVGIRESSIYNHYPNKKSVYFK